MTSFDYFPTFSKGCHESLWSGNAKGIHRETLPGATQLALPFDRPIYWGEGGEAHARSVAEREQPTDFALPRLIGNPSREAGRSKDPAEFAKVLPRALGKLGQPDEQRAKVVLTPKHPTP